VTLHRRLCGVLLESYKELHNWSVTNYSEFWEECFQFFDIVHSVRYSQVLMVEY